MRNLIYKLLVTFFYKNYLFSLINNMTSQFTTAQMKTFIGTMTPELWLVFLDVRQGSYQQGFIKSRIHQYIDELSAPLDSIDEVVVLVDRSQEGSIDTDSKATTVKVELIHSKPTGIACSYRDMTKKELISMLTDREEYVRCDSGRWAVVLEDADGSPGLDNAPCNYAAMKKGRLVTLLLRQDAVGKSSDAWLDVLTEWLSEPGFHHCNFMNMNTAYHSMNKKELIAAIKQRNIGVKSLCGKKKNILIEILAKDVIVKTTVRHLTTRDAKCRFSLNKFCNKHVLRVQRVLRVQKVLREQDVVYEKTAKRNLAIMVAEQLELYGKAAWRKKKTWANKPATIVRYTEYAKNMVGINRVIDSGELHTTTLAPTTMPYFDG